MIVLKDVEDYEISMDLIEKLKLEAIKSNYQAQAAEKTYLNALLSFWQNKYEKKIGTFSVKFPVICSLRSTDGIAEARLLYLRTSRFSNEPRLFFHLRIKSGKWGKTEYDIDAGKAFPCIITA